MDDMLKDFVVEARELATTVEQQLLSLERNPNDPNTLNAVFRAFHTIKGGAGFMGLPAMVSACHLTENLFDALRTGEAPVTPAAIEAALQASGFVADQLDQLANGQAPESLPTLPKNLEATLNAAIEGKTQAAAATEAPATATVLQESTPAETGINWQQYYNAVVPATTALSASNIAAAVAAPVLAASPVTAPEVVKVSAATKVVADAAVVVATSEVVQKAIAAPVKEDSIRVDAIKLDALLEVAGESVQAANQASVLLEKLAQFKFDTDAAPLMASLAETLNRASRYATELQRATLSTRMQPVGKLFQKFPRLVRELAKELGKEVDLVIEGAETEVDRVVVDSLYDPLVHMLRNALDHGIESTPERRAANKNDKSIIMLKAWQEAGSVMISLGDDGKGMDAKVLRHKAVSKGLISESISLTDEEAYQLVFLPGFSTKEFASSVSGRGVGMDVVKTAVVKHRGAIRIDSALGKGTSFTITLPIELSIVPTMLVRTCNAALGMPMAVVQRVVSLPDTYAAVGGLPVFRDQGVTMPVLSMADVLGYEKSVEKVGIVVSAPKPYILAVELVEGTADLVIKPMMALNVPGIAGTARSAEGELVLVIGLSFLLDGCRVREQQAA